MRSVRTSVCPAFDMQGQGRLPDTLHVTWTRVEELLLVEQEAFFFT